MPSSQTQAIGGCLPNRPRSKYHADHGTYAKQPAHLIRAEDRGSSNDEPTAEPPTAKKTRRPRKPTT
ncbi:hypothetical protein GCM10027290_39180 [Micromonospora sonneratiae]